MAMRIEKMTEGEIILLPKERKESMLQDSLVLAIRQSFHGNSDPANHLLKILPRVTSKRGSKEVIINYFEKWGSLIFDEAQGILKITKKRNSVAWTSEYESEVKANPWAKLIGAPAKETKTVYDADKEFRIVVARLQKVTEDSTKTLLHAFLVTKVQELLFAYGRTEDWVQEDKKRRTLFDQSTQRITTRASKFAKGSG
jgi:hypothetical protein